MAQDKPKKKIERWVAVLDEDTCDRCRQLHGQEFRKGEGPQPPLHDECRCKRVPAKSRGK